MRKEKMYCVYILILSMGFAAFSAWRASLDDQSVSFCVRNFVGIFLTGGCLAAAILLLYKMKVHIAVKASARKAWIDTLHGTGDLTLIAIWGSVYNQLVYAIGDGPVPAGTYWLTAAIVIILATIGMFVYYRWKEKAYTH